MKHYITFLPLRKQKNHLFIFCSQIGAILKYEII